MNLRSLDPQPPADTEQLTGTRLLLTVPEAARCLRIGTTTCYQMIARHEVPWLRLRGRLRVPLRVLEEWIEEGCPPRKFRQDGR